MPYYNPKQASKRFTPPVYNPVPPYSMSTAAPRQQKDLPGIPLPNEKEDQPAYKETRDNTFTFDGIIQYVRSHISIEVILLVGLIILLLHESVEDNLLYIVLFYILLF